MFTVAIDERILHSNHLHVPALQLAVEFILADIETLEVSRPAARRQIVAAMLLANYTVDFLRFHLCKR